MNCREQFNTTSDTPRCVFQCMSKVHAIFLTTWGNIAYGFPIVCHVFSMLKNLKLTHKKLFDIAENKVVVIFVLENAIKNDILG